MAENTIATAYVQLVASADGIQQNISEELGAAGSSGANSFSNAFGSTMATIGKVSGVIAMAAASGVAALTTQAVQSYSEYEQLVGGVETLFGDAQATVLDNASKAWATAGLSMNDYMESITAFAASLKQSTSDEVEAANVANMAIIDMSDNANKMGTSMESIQNAYQGFAKQNYTMLDNLKLGYGGTKTEMERLLQDATAISGIDYSIDNLSDVFEAIHVIQTELGITGTTSVEASETITGSLSSVKAAWANVITGIADENADFGGQLDSFTKSLSAFASNMLPRIATALSGVGKLVTQIAPMIIEQLPPLLEEMLPVFIEAFNTLISSIADVLPSLLTTVITALGAALPSIVDAVLKSLAKLLDSIGQALPTMIPALVTAIVETIITILDDLPLILDAALVLIQGLADGIIAALPVLIDALPAIIKGIVTFISQSTTAIMNAATILLMAICDAIPLIITEVEKILPDIIFAMVEVFQKCAPDMLLASVELLSMLLVAIPDIIAALWEALPEIVDAIGKSFKENWPKLVENGKEMGLEVLKGFAGSEVFTNIGTRAKEIVDKIKTTFSGYWSSFKDIGKNIIQGLIDGIKSMINNVGDAVTGVAENVANAFKDFFGIASPSKLFYSYGEFIDEGLVNGIDAGQDDVTSAMSALNNSMVTDFNDSAIVGNVHGAYAGSGANASDLIDLLATYLPIIADGKNVNVSLEGDAKSIFNLVRDENRSYIKSTGTSAFVY